MAAVLEPTDAVGPYRVQGRTESFYLLTAAENRMTICDGGWTIPAADVPAVLAALDQVEDWTRSAGIRVEPSGSYRAVRDGDVVVLSGPVYVYPSETPGDLTVGVVEIEHAHVPALRAALAGLP